MNDSENPPLVSVCVATYQHKDFIRVCLDSILNQVTNFSFEIILGEDESTDGTREICIEYAEKYHNIRLFLRSRKDVIYVQGRPTGRFNFTQNLKAAQGRYIALCEGDDYWTDKNKLQKQVDFLLKNPQYSLSGHDIITVNKDNKRISAMSLSKERKRNFSGQQLKCGLHVVTLTMLFQNVIPEFPKEFYKSYSGDLFLISILGQYGDFKFHNDISAGAYRKHDGGVWSGLDEINRRNGQRQAYFYMFKYYSRINDKFTSNELFKKYINMSKTLINTLHKENNFQRIPLIYLKISFQCLMEFKFRTFLSFTKFLFKKINKLEYRKWTS